MGTRANTDHVICDANDSGAFRCLHCGDRHLPVFPVPLDRYVEQGKGFALMHRRCEKRPEPSKQVAMFDELARREAQASVALDKDPDCGTRSCEAGDNPGIDATTDSPAPEIDPPIFEALEAAAAALSQPIFERRPTPYDKFFEMYPLATTHDELRLALRAVLEQEQFDRCIPTSGPLPWHPDSGIFNAIATWARIEKAYWDGVAHSQGPDRNDGKRNGLTIPARQPMPEKLREVLGLTEAKKKRGARPLTSGKRGKA